MLHVGVSDVLHDDQRKSDVELKDIYERKITTL